MVTVLKTVFAFFGERGFESHPLRHLELGFSGGNLCYSPEERCVKRQSIIIVNDKMQTDYRYGLTQPCGRNFHADFTPELTPKEMLELGIFGGKYMTDCRKEFPARWLTRAKLCSERHDPELNFFGVNASQPLSVWRKKGWINPDDPRGWFQWYCRYYVGRRHEDDERQIKRWKAIKRHVVQIRKNCLPGDLNCRRKQRQAVLHWAYDSRKI
jgi:hypothetical protein